MGKVIKLSLSDEEVKELEEKAAQAEYSSIQDFIRGSLLDGDTLLTPMEVCIATGNLYALQEGEEFTLDQLLPQSVLFRLQNRDQRFKGVVCKRLKKALDNIEGINIKKVRSGRKDVYVRM